MSDLTITNLWFQRAVPTPTDRNKDTQMGCHLEEVVEMLETLKVFSAEGNGAELLHAATQSLHILAEGLKKGTLTHTVADRKELLDALCDQIVTGTGIGHMHGLKVPEGLNRVNTSNFSKFDANGMPIFDANGKIAKNKETYKPADLEGLY